MIFSASRNKFASIFPLALFFSLVALCLALSACKKASPHTSDPQLEGIDELLAKELPPGTPMAGVVYFLHVRGYEIRDASEPHTVVAIVHHINLKTIQPEAARVTFRFDNDLKLVTYDLQPAPTLPIN